MPILFPQNIPTAILCATLTTVLLGGKPVIITEFFAFLHIAFGNNPDGAFGDQDVTVGVTGMVDIAGFVLESLAIDITLVSGKSGDFPLWKAVGGECDEALPTPMPLYTLGHMPCHRRLFPQWAFW